MTSERLAPAPLWLCDLSGEPCGRNRGPVMRCLCTTCMNYWDSVDAASEAEAIREAVEAAVAEATRALEERVAFAEQARDNAIVQRDKALDRLKTKGTSAGKRISALVALLKSIDLGDWARDRADKRVAEILGEGGDE